MADTITRAFAPVVNGTEILDTVFNGEVSNLVSAHNTLAGIVTIHEGLYEAVEGTGGYSSRLDTAEDDIAVLQPLVTSHEEQLTNLSFPAGLTANGVEIGLTADTLTVPNITLTGIMSFGSGATIGVSYAPDEPWTTDDGGTVWGARMSNGQIIGSYTFTASQTYQHQDLNISHLGFPVIVFSDSSPNEWATVTMPTSTVPAGVKVCIFNNQATQSITVNSSPLPAGEVQMWLHTGLGWKRLLTD